MEQTASIEQHFLHVDLVGVPGRAQNARQESLGPPRLSHSADNNKRRPVTTQSNDKRKKNGLNINISKYYRENGRKGSPADAGRGEIPASKM